MRRVTRRWALLGMGSLALCCGQKNNGDRELLVFAASSLTDAFTEVARAFESEQRGVRVLLSFGPSQALRAQIENGAEPQLYASANETHVEALVAQGLVKAPATFAVNRLVIVVPKDNPAQITSIAELTRAKRLVLSQPNVPAGAYALQCLRRASEELGTAFAEGVDASVVSRESNVRQTLAKVVLGEADAAVVYASDAVAAGDAVATIEIPEAFNVTASYPIAVVDESAHTDLSGAFVALLRSEAGRTILERHGFRGS